MEALANPACGNMAGEKPQHFPTGRAGTLPSVAKPGTDWAHDGVTSLDRRSARIHGEEPDDGPTHPPGIACHFVDQLMSRNDAKNEGRDWGNVLRELNERLAK